MTKVAILGGATALFTLTALGICAYHSQAHCSGSVGDVKTSRCTDTFKERCDRAYAVQINDDIGALEITSNVSCPWEPETAALGLIGFVLTIICLGFVFFTMRGKNLKSVVLALTALIVPILLAAFGLMIRDLKRGYDYKEESQLEEGFRPGTYIANIILLFFGVCTLSATAFLAHRQSTKN